MARFISSPSGNPRGSAADDTRSRHQSASDLAKRHEQAQFAPHDD
jgi:hypothetical protein